MNSDLYNDILRQATQLSSEDLLRLSEELSVQAAKNGTREHRLLDLKGLGSEIWQGNDAADYVAGERDSWDG